MTLPLPRSSDTSRYLHTNMALSYARATSQQLYIIIHMHVHKGSFVYSVHDCLHHHS